jgi:hypothetical protein
MIAAILGLPASEASYFTRRVYTLAQAVSPIYPLADHPRIETAARELYAYVEGHLAAAPRFTSAGPRSKPLSETKSRRAWRTDTWLATAIARSRPISRKIRAGPTTYGDLSPPITERTVTLTGARALALRSSGSPRTDIGSRWLL